LHYKQEVAGSIPASTTLCIQLLGDTVTENTEQNLLAELEAELHINSNYTKDLQESLAPLNAQEAELKAAKAEELRIFEERVRQINADMLKLQEERYEQAKALREAERRAESIQRQIDQERRRIEAERLQAEKDARLKEIQEKWDKETIGAPWREWAKEHQIVGARKIAQAGGIICADGMGLGKTLTSIAALDMIRTATASAREDNPFEPSGSGARPVTRPCGQKVLYFCPATMINNVVREVRRWAPHRSVAVLGGMSKAQRAFVMDGLVHANECVVIINYEAWRKQLALIDDLISVGFDTVIVDEAHNVKDRKSQAYRGIIRIIRESNYSEGVEFVLPMTGTPILNKPQELFSLLTLVDKHHFFSEEYFLQDFCQQNLYTGKWEFKTGGLDSLAKKIANIYFRRTKDQAGIKLPPKTVTVHDVMIDEEAYPNQARARTEMRTWGSIMLEPQSGKAISAASDRNMACWY
jgi:SNF2 family DNA or RNA helicase